MSNALISILMGSKSDWAIMEETSKMLDKLNIPHEARALSAHRTPDALFQYIKEAEARPDRMAIINPFKKTVSFAPMYATSVATLYSTDWSKSLNGLVLLDTSGVLHIYTTARQWNTPITSGAGPSPRNAACLVSAGDEIIVYGGYSWGVKMSLGDIRILNITSMTWRSGANNTAENNRSKASCGYSNGQLIVWGGVNTGQQADILGTATPLIYDLKADKWVSNYVAPTIAQPNPTNSGSSPSSGGTSNPTGTTSPQGAQTTGGSNVAMIVGIAGGLFTLLVLGGLLFLCKLKRRKITNLNTENNNDFGNADIKNPSPLSPSSTLSLSPHSCQSQPLPVYQARAPQYSPQAEGVKEQHRVYSPHGINDFYGTSDNSIPQGPHTQQ